MKKIIGMGVLSIAAMTLLIGVFAGQKNEFKEAKGYSTSSLPTTIDLNDTSAANIRSYYSSLNNLSTSERQGTNLLKNLKTILKNGQKYYSYDSGSVIWQIYEISDRDWAKSPASSTTYGTYNSSTKKITNYVYGTSASSSKNNPYIHALYINRNVTNQTTAWDNHNQDQWGINREHVWPKAEGFDDSGAGGARGDPMHLMAGNGYANNIHSNYYYGYVKKSSSYTDCGDKYSNQSGNLRGTSKTLNTGTVFEPQDCDKGDIARAIFYMVARYNYLSGSDSDGIDSNNPNLTLTQSISDWASSGYSSTTSNQGKMGILTDLLAWHHADPVDEYEIHRNNLLYTNYTNNRNPFIDFPEWVDYIWGTATYSGTTYQSYNSTPTGYATPSSDTINGYNSGSSDPKVNSVTVSPSTLSLDLNGTKSGTLTATVSVSNGASQSVSWSISPSGQGVTVNSGVVTASNNATTGEYTVTARSTYDNTKYGTCTVTVSDSSQSGGQSYSSTLSVGTNGNTTWSNGVRTTSATVDDVTFTALYSVDNDGKYYSSDNSWRFYTASDSGVRISVPAGYYITSVVLTWKTGQPSTPSGTTASGTTSPTTYTVLGQNVTSLDFTRNSSNFLLQTAVVNYEYSGSTASPSSLTASINKTFYVGDTITADDITLKDNLNNVYDDFEFDDYQFTYEDAPSGGSSENYYFHIPHDDLSATLVVPVSRKNYVAPSTSTKIYNGEDFSTLQTSYTENQNITLSGTTFKVNGYYYYNSNNGYSYLSISKTKTNAPGFIQNTTPYSTGITNVQVLFSGPDVQLSVDGNTWVDLSSANTSTNNYYYFKVFYKNTTQENYVNIYKITVTLKGEETATNVANYVMFEDTEGQCNTKFDIASCYFENMSKSQRSTFMTNNDYVISTARDRFEAWALNQGKTINYTGGDYVISSNNVSPILKESNQSTIIVVVSISAISLLAIGMFLLKYKKKED